MREESYTTSFKRVGKVLAITVGYLGTALAIGGGAVVGVLSIAYIGYVLYLTCKPKY